MICVLFLFLSFFRLVRLFFLFLKTETSGIMPEKSRTNKLLQMYSDACVELCREMDIKAVDLFTSMQKRKDWSTVCFT